MCPCVLFLSCDTSLGNGDTSSSFYFSFWASVGQFLYNISFIHLFSVLLLALQKGLHGALPQDPWQQNIGSLYLSESCYFFVNFFFDFSIATGYWHSLLCLRQRHQGTNGFGTRSSLRGKKKSLQNCYARHTEKVSCSHSLMIWRVREHVFVSQPRMRNLQTVLLFCSV